MNKLKLSIPSDWSNIKQVENFIENLIREFQLDEKLQGKVVVSVVEAVNNAILSGNKLDPQKVVKLTAIKSIKKVIITVEDEGEGFDFKRIPDPTTPDKFIQATGRGLYLMSSLTDKLLFTKNGAKVIMIFKLNP